MNSEQFARLKEILLAAADLPASERDAYLGEACGGDQELRESVEAMLIHDADSTSQHLGVDTSALDPLPDRIGEYRILQRIGEGGMGVVYEAEQTGALSRRVALKIIKLGMDTEQVVARFEAERQALAMMDHPGIAQVYEAGSTETGRPFFVMELIRGLPITGYCDQERLSLSERLELFVRVCHAVQHAHHKGIVHRDIKPSNVLVTQVNDRPAVKVIDFGIAKATGHNLVEQTAVTMMGQLVGTPMYMSPEQADPLAADIDTRSDVYSLGVLLYELITGTTPFEAERISGAGYDEIRRMIREEDTPTASHRVSTLGERLGEIASNRRIDYRRFSSLVRGDLDAILLMALEKDRDRRYSAAHDFARDIESFLNDKPVQATFPSKAYRLKKFVRRNRGPVIAAGVVTLALVGLAVTMSVLRGQAEDARREAQAAVGRLEVARADLETVADFQASMLSELDAETIGRHLFESLRTRLDAELEGDPGKDAALAFITSRLQLLNPTDVALGVLDDDILTRAEEAVAAEFVDRPEVRGRLEHSLGRTAFELGLYERGEALLAQAIETFEEIGSEAGAVAVRSDLANLHVFAGNWESAAAEIERALADGRRVLGPDHPDALGALAIEALLYREQQKWAEADSLFTELVERCIRVHGADAVETLEAREGQAYAWSYLERFDEAEAAYSELVSAARRLLGNDHLATLAFLNNAGQNYVRMERYDEALVLYGEAMEGGRRVQGSDHSETYISIINLGRLYTRLGRNEEAEALGREALDIAERTMPPQSVDMAMSCAVLGDGLYGQGRHAEAKKYLVRAHHIFVEAFGLASGGATAMARMIVEGLESRGMVEEVEVWRARAEPEGSP